MLSNICKTISGILELEKRWEEVANIDGAQYICREIVKKGKIETLLENFWEKIKGHDFHTKFQQLRFKKLRVNAIKKFFKGTQNPIYFDGFIFDSRLLTIYYSNN